MASEDRRGFSQSPGASTARLKERKLKPRLAAFQRATEEGGPVQGSLSLALALLAAAPPVLVDEGVTEVRTCSISALAFRTAMDGWMFDHCGAAYRSEDGGYSWRKAPEIEWQFFGGAGPGSLGHPFIQHLMWLDASTGLAFAYGASRVFRTEDAGLSWQAATLPSKDSERLYGVDHVGDRVWFCGSTGRVSWSADAGRSWTAGEQLFDAADINPTNWCAALSFLDANDGWAAGWRTLWRTSDGGVTWTESSPVLPPAGSARRPDVVHGMVRLNAKVAWARTRGGTQWRTKDGGESWSKVASSRVRPAVAHRADGRALVLAQMPEGDRLEDVVPMADARWVAVGASGVMNQALERFDGGHLMRRGPPVGAPSGKTVALEGRTSGQGVEWGWAGPAVFRSDDEGRSWRRVGTLEAPITRLAALNEAQVLGRVGASLYRSDDGGATWRTFDDGAIRADWSRLTGEKDLAPEQHQSLECALSGPARVKIEFGAQGCFGGSKDSLTLTVAADGRGRLQGAFKEWDRSSRRFLEHSVERSLSRRETSDTLRRLSSDVMRLERPSGCESTVRIFANLEWTCGRNPSQVLEYSTHDCGRGMAPGVASESRFGVDHGEGYSRAAGVSATAAALLRQSAGE